LFNALKNLEERNYVMKKLMTILLSVIMVMAMMPAMAFANEVAPAEEPAAITEADDFIEALNGNAATINISGTIELSQPVTITRNVKIIGTDDAKLKADGVLGNFITVENAGDVTFENLTLVSDDSDGTKSTLHVYGSTFSGKDLTIVHNGKAGAPVIVNHGSNATFTGVLNLTMNGNSWYGMNVDGANVDLTGATLNVTSSSALGNTQSAICAEGSNPAVSGAGEFTIVKTASDGGATQSQIAYVAADNLPEFIAAKSAANADITEIELQGDVTIKTQLEIKEAMTINGNGHTISGPAETTAAPWNLVTVDSVKDKVEIKDITLKTSKANKSALHVYLATDTAIEKVVFDTTTTSGGAGVVVNGATVNFKGDIEFKNGENTWGGINVDTKNGNAAVKFAEDAEVTANGTQDVIYQDKDTNQTGTVTVEGADKVGLEQDKDGNYIVKPAPVTPPYIPPTTQTPTIDAGENATVTLSDYGTKATIKVADGYELVDVTVNGVSKGKVDTLTGLKTGDKVVVTTKKIDTTADEIAAVKATKLVARSANAKAPSGKKAIKVYWFNKDGSELNFDGYEIYRSTKKNSFGKKPIYTAKKTQYFNTSAKKGTRYYYKVRGYKVIGGEKVYTDFSLKAIRTAK